MLLKDNLPMNTSHPAENLIPKDESPLSHGWAELEQEAWHLRSRPSHLHYTVLFPLHTLHKYKWSLGHSPSSH